MLICFVERVVTVVDWAFEETSESERKLCSVSRD